MAKISKRRCVVCRQSTEKVSLIRIIYSEDQILIEREKKLGGRGAYIHKSSECVLKLNVKIPFNKIFRTKINSNCSDFKQKIDTLKESLLQF